MARYILAIGAEVLQVIDTDRLEPDEFDALEELNKAGRLRFERLVVDRLPDLSFSHLGLIAEEIVSAPRGRYDPKTTRNAEIRTGRKAVRR